MHWGLGIVEPAHCAASALAETLHLSRGWFAIDQNIRSLWLLIIVVLGIFIRIVIVGVAYNELRVV